MGKLFPFPSTLHFVCCNERFHQRAKSTFLATRQKHQSPHFQLQKEMLLQPSLLARNKRLANRDCLLWVNCSHSHPPCIFYVAMSASSKMLEALIPAFSTGKEGDVASSPSLVVKNRRSANRHLLARVNCSRSHPPCIFYVAMSASNNAPKASNPTFSVAKKGAVASSPSLAVKNKRSPNKHLFAVSKLFPFASPAHDELQLAFPTTS